MAARKLYRIRFVNQGQIYEIYARGVSHGTLLGFLEVESLVFGERTQVVVDPSEERLKTEFGGVRRTFIPVHAVVRIDEVEKEGIGSITEGPKEGGVLTPFPVFGPGKGPARD